MKKIYDNITKCRVCGSEQLTEVVKIEKQYLSPTFVETNENNPLASYQVPQTLILCDKNKNPTGCGLLQLKETVQPDYLYKNYFYRSAINDTMRRDLNDVVVDSLSRIEIEKEDIVVDIGANDCTMIDYFPSELTRIGVEPAENICWDHVDSSIHIVNDYFSKDSLVPLVGNKKIKIFTSCAMFYDLDDPNSFVADIKTMLHPNGIWCVQLSYLPLMLENINFYDICNEHLEYYSLHTLSILMQRHDLKIVDASKNEVNGGSIRVFVAHESGSSVESPTLLSLYEAEIALNLFDANTFFKFHERIIALREKVGRCVMGEIEKGKLVIGLGASSKGNMLLQFFGITKNELPYISERNPEKVGLRTLGTDIELISEEKGRSLRPSCMLVLPWYFKNEIVARERDYIASGGMLLFPMPYPHLVHSDGETKL